MTKPLPTDLPYHSFTSASEFDGFLEANHATLPAFYLKLAKKSAGVKSITADEAIEVGLCHGWIDGWGRSIDDKWYFKRYTPRRPKSIWSQKNVATVGRLTEAGRMRPAGIATVEAAQKDGRWDRAYGGPSNIEVPEDLAAALAKNKAASKFFNGLNRSDRYSVLWRIQTASPTARAGRLEAMLAMLTNEEVPSQWKGAKSTGKAEHVKEDPKSKKRTRQVSEEVAPVRRTSSRKRN